MKHRMLRPVIYLAAGSLLLAAFFPIRAGGTLGEPQEGVSCRHKLARLWQTAQSGGSDRVSFTEREINAHLASVLAANPGIRQARGLKVGVEDLRFDIVDEEVCFFVIGRIFFLPFVLEYRTSGQVHPDDNPARLASVRLGRVPLIQPLKWVAAGHLDQLTDGLRAEREILDHLTDLDVEGDRIHIAVGSG